MSHKKYSSYDEIDHDLKILKLEREIHLHKIALHIDKTKENLTLPNMIEGYLGFSQHNSSVKGIGKLVLRVIPFVIKWFRKA